MDKNNFGDQLTPWLLAREGIVAVHRRPAEAALIGVGSVIEHAPANYCGTFWGTGLMFDHEPALPNAAFIGVRGSLTAERLSLGAVVLGDPGLLIGDHIRRRAQRARIGIVPHFRHRDVFRDLWPDAAKRGCAWVDVRRHPAAVGRAIAGCGAIVTSSLHGLITADSLGIPAVWVRLDPPLEGGTFKFYDHEAVATPRRTRQVDPDVLGNPDLIERLASPADADSVATATRALRGTFPTLQKQFARYRMSPWLGWRHHLSGEKFGSGKNSWPTS